ncbi:predicted protein [Plenodomus lingam JN3]|uniref:Predicted protein n=1 Tax=Leptosphaeria maculans (strain JN3 / isolate v23.1.3 / race Av1-4-5-6-7-8) TaxID=985895 RepID=E5A269_LEPMJ|nr:predicted protein [Plenodomus lingam JN3]CBX97946.1 predicted protein [Plenodomus lingam JN3]
MATRTNRQMKPTNRNVHMASKIHTVYSEVIIRASPFVQLHMANVCIAAKPLQRLTGGG